MSIWALDFTSGVDNGQGGEWVVNVQSATFTVTNATQAVNCQITTSTPHGLGVGDHVHFRNIGGMTQLNSTQDFYETGTHKRVASIIDATNFTLDIDSTGFGAYTSGGTMYHMGAGRSNPTHVRIPNHKFKENEIIRVTGVGGTTQLNNTTYKVKNITPNAIQLANLNDDLIDGSSFGIYSSGGTVTAYRRLVSSITKANPAVLTVSGHGFTNGQVVFLEGGDMTEITGKAIVVANATSDTFEASGIDSTSFTTYTDGCFVRRPALSNHYLQYTIPDDILEEGSEIRVRSTTDPVQRTTADCTWTNGGYTVATSTSLVGTVAIGDLVGRQLLGGNGEVERLYKVTGINATTITLDTRYFGTTGTDSSSLYHLPLTSIPTAGFSGSYVIANGRNCTVKGGYDSTFQNQTGQTWLRHAFPETSSNNSGIYTNTGNIDKINFVDGYYCLYANADGTVENCTFLSSRIYCGYIASECTINNCIFGSTGSHSYPCLYQTTSNQVNYTNTYVWGATSHLTSSIAVRLNASNTTLDSAGLFPVNAGSGFEISAPSVSLKNLTITSCYYSIYVGSSDRNFHIESCTFVNPNVNGNLINISSQTQGGLIKNINLQGTSILINTSQLQGAIFENCSFSNYAIGVSLDQYSGSVFFENCNFNAPSTFGVNIGSGSVRDVVFRGCTITAGNEHKAFNLLTTAPLGVPNYILENSFGLSGKYFGQAHFISDYTNYFNVPPSLQISINTNINNNFRPVEIVSEWVRSGIGRKFKLKMKRDAIVFTGTITPVFYLNGVEKNTLSAISSLSTSWTDYEFDCPAVSIDAEGHLELRFIINGNASTFWIDEFNVEDL